MTKVKIIRETYFTGVLQVASDGSRGTGKRLTNHKVQIIRILDRNVPYPVLLGDSFTNSLGWASYDDLRSITTVRASTD